MKKLLTIVSILVLTASFAACTQKKADEATEEVEVKTEPAAPAEAAPAPAEAAPSEAAPAEAPQH